LVAPPGRATRPTADRVRQALFDMLMHAPWCGREVIEGARVLDVFAGTGAFGLEALSRGAGSALFIENDAAALRALRANIAACGAERHAKVLASDVLSLTTRPDEACTVIFLDPPYGQGLLDPSIARLRQLGWIGNGGLVIAETAEEEDWQPTASILAARRYGAARLIIYRL
jgi:16S rRNA (guanine966-N2)-methyltransferase